MAVDKKGPTFAPLPARAMADERLTALDLRVLAALAVHDRLGANGTGCYASHRRLVDIVRCHLKSLSRSLRTLAELGYIEAGQHPMMRRLRVYRVIYTEADLATVKRPIGSEPVTDTTRNDDAENRNDGAIGNEFAPDDDAIGNRDFQEVRQSQWDTDAEVYSGNRGRDSAEAGEYNSTVVASPDSAAMPRSEEGPNRGDQRFAYLAQAERWFKALNGRELSVDEVRNLRRVREGCEAIETETFHGDDALHFWAQRLAGDIGWQLEAGEAA